MCAINGFSFKNSELIQKMNSVTQHRGPDDTGVFLSEHISFGHNRLSIIDLSQKAHQPMVKDGLTIIFNGEIYNFKEIRRELNINFTSNSDTEVILESFRKWGKDCVKKFNGIFAFAIWNEDTQELFLARDHVGVKPLYYFHDNQQFIFSSEIKAILEHDIPRKLDIEAFNHYLRIQYVPEPRTMFEGIYKLPPASIAVFKNGALEIEKYWDVDIEKQKYAKEELDRLVQEQIDNAVKRQLISDRPVGIYLSGGFDSTSVLDAVSRTGAKEINTFSIGFDIKADEEREKFNADFNLAARTAKEYGTKHNEVLISQNDVIDLFEKTVVQSDEPISNATAIAMMRLAQFAKEKVAVVLGGDGGDENFGGYDRYQLSYYASLYEKVPRFIRNQLDFHPKLHKLNTRPGVDRFAQFMFQKDPIIERTIHGKYFEPNTSFNYFEEKYFDDFGKRDFEDLFMEVDRKNWLVDQSLTLSDKMSMGAGLEQRVPLLDRELIEFATNIPVREKVTLTQMKKVLKDSMRDRLPEYLYTEPKRGWFSPGAKWLRVDPFLSYAKEVLSPSYYPQTNELFDWDEIALVLENHVERKEYNLIILWSILTFQIWAKTYKVTL